MEKVKGKQKVDTYNHKGWLNSDHFLKRAFAILGHYVVAILIIYGILIGIALLFGLIFLIIKLVSKI